MKSNRHLCKSLLNLVSTHNSKKLHLLAIIKMKINQLLYQFVVLCPSRIPYTYSTTNYLNSMVALSEEIIEHRDIVSSMFKGMEEVKESLNYVQLSKAMFDAAKCGNIMILEILLEYHPDLLFEVNSEQRTLLHIAILYQRRAIYRLILSKGDSKNVMTQLVDFEGNNVLHLAAKWVPKRTIGSPAHHIIMRRQALFQVYKST